MLAALGSSGLVLGAVRAGRAPKPNIVFIESDSMDGRVMGCMGHHAAYTPHMDRLAARGVLFRNAYCNSPQCCPSRSSMWSGRHTHEIEGWNNHKGIEPGAPTFLTQLKAAGYRSFVTGKTDYVSGGHSLGARVWAWTRGADIPLAQKMRPVAEVQDVDGERFKRSDWKRVDESVAWLKKHAGASEYPFMLYCGLSAPHPPFKTSKTWLDRIDEDAIRVPPYEAALHPVMEYMSETKNTDGTFSDDEIKSIRRVYFAMIAELDAMVGALMDCVEELGLADSTYFVYCSDHGEMNMEHRQYLKNSLHEASARVPLIVAGPGVRRGASVEDLVSLLDVYPTLMDMAGVGHPEGLSGHSLFGALRGEAMERPAWVLSQYHSNFANTDIFMLREGPWKYIAYAGYEPQLFNLDDDPDEMTNLASSNTDVAGAMDAKLRSIVDYEAVDAKAKAYDRASFGAWLEEMGEKEALASLGTLFKEPWDDSHTRRLKAWFSEA